MSLYKCPFCRLEIDSSIDVLLMHREKNGECEKEQERIRVEGSKTKTNV